MSLLDVAPRFVAELVWPPTSVCPDCGCGLVWTKWVYECTNCDKLVTRSQYERHYNLK